MNLTLNGKTAIVTGGSKGIGKAIAAAFAYVHWINRHGRHRQAEGA